MGAISIVLFAGIHGGTVLRVVHPTNIVLLNSQGDDIGLDATFRIPNTDNLVSLISTRVTVKTSDQVEIREEQVVVTTVHRKKMLGRPPIVKFISEATTNERAVLNRQMGIINVIDTSKRENLLLIREIVATDLHLLMTQDIDGNTIMIMMLSLVNQSQENASGGNTKVK